jgi:hypothetical protein
MNKKYLILFIGVIVLFAIFAGVLFLQTNQSSKPPTPSSLQSQNPANLQPSHQASGQTNPQSDTNVSPTVKLQPLASTAKEATKQFYTYYFSSPTNPLANGAYKNNSYLSEDLKNVMTSLYNNGNAPLFCPQNKRSNVVVGQEQQIYYTTQYITREVISEAPPGNKDLYRVLLENNGGQWQIFDVNCVY